MKTELLASKYIDTAQDVLQKLQTNTVNFKVEPNRVQEVIAWAKDYLEDARYFREKKRFDTSLTSVAYCEGLLDALRLLGAVSFEWPTKAKRKRRAK
jgi:hypothetical protein